MEGLVMASSSAHDAINSQRQPRKRADIPNYNMPGQKIPSVVICDRHESRLRPALVPLARAVFKFDYELLRRVNLVDQKNDSSADEARKAKAIRRIETFIEIKLQWKDIDVGRRQFSESYMGNIYFIEIWAEGLQIVKNVLRSKNVSGNQHKIRDDYVQILANYESRACNLRDQMVDAARQGLLEEDVLHSIQERWIRLDELLDWYYDSCSRDVDADEFPIFRSAPKWQEVRHLVQTEDPRTGSDKEPLHIQLASRSRNAFQLDTTATLLGFRIDNALILWSALFGCAVTSTASFALGYAHSPHLQGTKNDADFWFLIPSTTMQLLGLLISALLEWKTGGLPKWRWVLPSAIAACCSIIAIPLYLILPTEWSSFLSLVAGATQSFMVLQYFLS